jgi:hypothetical protein
MITKHRIAFLSSVHPGEGDNTLHLIAIDSPKTNSNLIRPSMNTALNEEPQGQFRYVDIFMRTFYITSCLTEGMVFAVCQEGTHITMISFFYAD